MQYFYNSDDMNRLQSAILDSVLTLPKPDRDLAAAYWQNGVNAWQSGPVCPEPYAGGDLDCKIVVVDGTYKGNVLLLQDFIDLCWRIHAAMPVGDLAGKWDAIIQDIASGAGSEEPWPAV